MGVIIPTTKGAGEQAIAEAESRLSCRLPASYRDFIGRHNGAKPSDNAFSLSGNESGVRSFIPIEEAATLRDQIEGFPSHAIPIAEDGCGNYVWLEPDAGAVFFWDHELDESGVRIADSFEDFLALLRPFDPSSVKLKPGQVIRVWIDPNFKPEFD